MLKWCTLVALVLWLAACSHKDNSTPSPAQNTYRAELPLNITFDTLRQLITPTLLVTVNGVANNVIFDTGSWGLRILPGALKNANLSITQKLLDYNYGTGTGEIYIRGREANGTFSIGNLSTTTPIHLMLIDTIRRSLTDPGRSTLDSVTIPNNHFRNFAGILGVGLRNGSSIDVASPLAQLPGNNSFIVRFPTYGQATGKLIMNPSDDELAGFTFFQLVRGAYSLPNGLPSWLDSQVNGIALINGSPLRAPTLLDTGTSPTAIYANGLPTYGLLSKGTVVHLGVAQPGQTSPVVDTTIMVNTRVGGKDRFYTYTTTATDPSMIYGTNFFYLFDVYYDQQRGRIGIKRK